MIRKILNKDKISNIDKVKKKFNIFRAILIKSEQEIRSVEFMTKNGVFRGFGKSTKEAYKNAKKVIKNYYKNQEENQHLRYMNL